MDIPISIITETRRQGEFIVRELKMQQNFLNLILEELKKLNKTMEEMKNDLHIIAGNDHSRICNK
jgi:hypothetical protein